MNQWHHLELQVLFFSATVENMHKRQWACTMVVSNMRQVQQRAISFIHTFKLMIIIVDVYWSKEESYFQTGYTRFVHLHIYRSYWGWFMSVVCPVHLSPTVHVQSVSLTCRSLYILVCELFVNIFNLVINFISSFQRYSNVCVCALALSVCPIVPFYY